jgi:PKD repeat protein
VLATSQPSQSAPSAQRLKRMLLAGLAVLALGGVFAPTAFALDPDFTVDPTPPIAGKEATFTASNIPDGATVTWRYDTGAFVSDTTHTFADAGAYDVTMRVNDGADHDFTKTILVKSAAFHRDPAASIVLETGQPATFTSDSSPGSTLSWEIDGVAFGDAESVTTSFTSSGSHVVRLDTVHNGQSDVAVSVFRVNAPPVAGFVWSPGSPVAGGVVELLSTSVDAEGALASEAWELDSDGDFDDALGSSATASFAAGDHEVSLRVRDSDGVERVITRTITIAAAPAPPAQPPPPAAPAAPAAPRLMSPFPTVRLVGVVVPAGARITLVEVRGGPRGARVTVRCTGKGCPFRLRRRVAETGRVRLSAFKRVLAAGARIEVFVRAPGVIGKYVAFRIRAGKRPVRTDRCLMPGASQPTRCT